MANYNTTTLNEIDIPLIAERIGPNGPGFAIIEHGVLPAINYRILNELNEPDVPWFASKSTNINDQGAQVIQIFDVFAHKFSRGSQERLERMPGLNILARIATRKVVEPLSEHFESLNDWTVDEAITQRYPRDAGKLSWHRDLLRHPGVIITFSLDGQATLGMRHDGKETYHELLPGFMTIMRARGLYKPPFLRGGRIDNQHQISSPQGASGRTSVTIRANGYPDEPVSNFSYYNWDPNAED